MSSIEDTGGFCENEGSYVCTLQQSEVESGSE